MAKKNIEQSAEDHDPRRTLRLAIPETLVAIDAPSVSPEPWVVSAIDINSGGLGLILPEELEEGTPVELSFQLGGDKFARVPALVRHRFSFGSGGVAFAPWPVEDRQRFLEYLVAAYERTAAES